MIRLEGFTLEDIPIRFIGLRPGEKLFEELKLDGEDIIPTCHKQIKIFRGDQVTMQSLVPWIGELQHLLWAQEGMRMVEHLKKLVPEYQESPLQEPQGASDRDEASVGAPLLGGLRAATIVPAGRRDVASYPL